MGRGSVAGISLVLAATLSVKSASAAEDASLETNAMMVSGQALTALGAGTLSAMFAPFVVCALPRLVDEASCTPFLLREEAAPIAMGLTVGGALALAFGLGLWNKGVRVARKRAGGPKLRPVNKHMYRAGVGLTSAGAGLAGASVLLSYFAGLCGPKPCGEEYRYAAVGGAIGGAVLAATGIPLWVIGNDKVAVHSAAPSAVKLTPTSAALTWSF